MLDVDEITRVEDLIKSCFILAGETDDVLAKEEDRFLVRLLSVLKVVTKWMEG